MFDNYEPHQFVEALTFGFKSNRFEIWQNGQLVQAKTGSNTIGAELGDKIGTFNISVFGTISFADIKANNTFEKAFTLHDRIIFVTIPEPSNRDIVGIISLRQTSGVTNSGKVFHFSEPYCCSLFTLKQQINKVTFSFSNPERLIEFYSDDLMPNPTNLTQNVDTLAEQILIDIKSGQSSNGRQKMNKLFSLIKEKPSLIGETKAPGKLGKAFVLMLNNKFSSDDDTIEAIACIAYVLITKAILQTPSPNLYLDRLLIIEFSRDQFNYSIQSALDVSEGESIDFFSPVEQMGGTKARDVILNMEIADLYTNPILYQKVNIFKDKKVNFDQMIANDFFYNKALPDLINEGKAYHEKVYKYFYDKIIINEDIEV